MLDRYLYYLGSGSVVIGGTNISQLPPTSQNSFEQLILEIEYCQLSWVIGGSLWRQWWWASALWKRPTVVTSRGGVGCGGLWLVATVEARDWNSSFWRVGSDWEGFQRFEGCRDGWRWRAMRLGDDGVEDRLLEAVWNWTVDRVLRWVERAMKCVMGLE